MDSKLARRIKYTIRVILAYVIALLFLAPFLWMLISSFKKDIDITASPPKLFFDPIISNYHNIIQWGGERTGLFRFPVLGCLENSLIVSIIATGIALLVGIIAGYSLSRFKSKKREWIRIWILSAVIAPPVVFMVPYFMIARILGLFDSYTLLIIASTTISLPFTIWMMIGFFNDIPKDLEEAAYIDGCSPLKAFLIISLPLAKPGISAAATLSFINVWNNLIFPLALTADRVKTIPLAVQGFLGWTRIFYGMMIATGVLATIPALVITIFASKILVGGLTLGAVKG